jgi:hypothetical protein
VEQPPATPAWTPPGAASTVTDSARAQWPLERRGTPWFANAIAGDSGALVAIGVIAIGGDVYPKNGHGPGWAGAGLSVALIVAGLFAFRLLPPLLHAAGVAMVAIGIASAMGFIQFPGVHHVADLRVFFAVTIAAWFIAFAVGPTKARPILLSLALLLGLTWATVEVADVNLGSLSPFPVTSSASASGSIGAGSSVTYSSNDTLPADGTYPTTFRRPSKPNWGQLGGVSLAFAAVYLLGVAVLDARGRRGLATAAVLPGVIALVAAIVFFSAQARSLWVTGLVSVAAGLFCGSVGAQAHRRFTVWTGAFISTVGALFLTGKIADSTTNNSGAGNSHTATVFGLFTIIFGVVMIVVAMLVARLLRESMQGDAAVPPSTAPTF